MLDKFFSKSIKLDIDGQTIRFSSPSEFKFFLSGKTAIPSSRVQDMVKHNTEQLQAEAQLIKKNEKHFVSILAQLIEKNGNTDHFFRESDINRFSQDHGWRQIAAALNDGKDHHFRKIALVKYLQYLSSRQEVIKHLYSEKKKYETKQQEEKAAQLDDALINKETLVLESALFENAGSTSDDEKFGRVPKGEPIPVTLEYGQSIPIFLSKHKFEIQHGDQLLFISQMGKQQQIFLGQNRVGRDLSSTILVDNDLRDISRLHLVIEHSGDGELEITDLSSHGTFLPLELLEHDI